MHKTAFAVVDTREKDVNRFFCTVLSDLGGWPHVVCVVYPDGRLITNHAYRRGGEMEQCTPERGDGGEE